MANKLFSEELTSGWSFKQTDDTSQDAWLPVAHVPSVVHQDLMDNKKLADPFIAFNEIDAGWVGEKSWTYRTKLQRPSSATKEATLVLAFDGLDTFAEVRLDDKIILQSDNMFFTPASRRHDAAERREYPRPTNQVRFRAP